jgi:hypothetical protein
LWIAVKYVDLVDPVEVVVELPNSFLLVLVSYQKFKSGGQGVLTAGKEELWQNVSILTCC